MVKAAKSRENLDPENPKHELEMQMSDADMTLHLRFVLISQQVVSTRVAILSNLNPGSELLSEIRRAQSQLRQAIDPRATLAIRHSKDMVLARRNFQVPSFKMREAVNIDIFQAFRNFKNLLLQL